MRGFMVGPASLAENGLASFGLERHLAFGAAFAADGVEGRGFMESFEQLVLFKAGPTSFGIAQHFRVFF